MKAEEFLKLYSEKLKTDARKISDISQKNAILSLRTIINENGGSITKENQEEIKRSFAISYWLKSIPDLFDKSQLDIGPLSVYDQVVIDIGYAEPEENKKSNKRRM